MTPIRTDYSNVTYTADGCFDLPFYKGLKME